MLLDLESLGHHARALSFSVNRRSADVLEVVLLENATLVFKNLPDTDDNAFGFETTPWHAHDKLYWTCSDGEMYQFNPIEVLSGLRSGDLIVVARYTAGELKNMWIDHARGLGAFEFDEGGQEIRAWRIG